MLHPNQLVLICTQLIPCWHDFGSSRASEILLLNSGVNTCSPSFGIKVILFQNYHVCISDWSTVTGREPWSGVHYLSLLTSTHKPMPQNFLQECHCFTGTWIHLPGPAIKCLSDPTRAIQQFSHVSPLSVSSSVLDSAGPSMVYSSAMKILSG